MLLGPRNLLSSLKPVNSKTIHPRFVRPYSTNLIFLIPNVLRFGQRNSIGAVKSNAGDRLQGIQEARCLGFLQRLRTDGS